MCNSPDQLRKCHRTAGEEGGYYVVSREAAEARGNATEHRMAWFTLTDNYALIPEEEEYREGLRADLMSII